MNEIALRNVEKRFGGAAILRGISLTIRDGEFISLVGPSGCGKSTLLRIIAGLEEQDAGELLLGGRSLEGRRPAERDIAMVFQSYALYPHMTVRQNLSVPLVMRRLSSAQRWPLLGQYIGRAREIRREIAGEVDAVAASLDITPLLDRRPVQLSGGQRQRVALGRAIVRRPAAFLMDEPLSNLDARLRLQTRAELVALHRRLRTTFIYVTHDQAEAMTMSDRVAVMMRGELLQVAPPQELYSLPDHIDVATFIGSPRINLFPAEIGRSGRIESGHHFRLPIAGSTSASPVLLGVRPEAMRLDSSSRSSGWGGQVLHVENLGSEIFVHVILDELAGTTAIVRLDPLIDSAPLLGAAVRVTPRPASSIHIFGADGRRQGTVMSPLEEVVDA